MRHRCASLLRPRSRRAVEWIHGASRAAMALALGSARDQGAAFSSTPETSACAVDVVLLGRWSSRGDLVSSPWCEVARRPSMVANTTDVCSASNNSDVGHQWGMLSVDCCLGIFLQQGKDSYCYDRLLHNSYLARRRGEPPLCVWMWFCWGDGTAVWISMRRGGHEISCVHYMVVARRPTGHPCCRSPPASVTSCNVSLPPPLKATCRLSS